MKHLTLKKFRSTAIIQKRYLNEILMKSSSRLMDNGLPFCVADGSSEIQCPCLENFSGAFCKECKEGFYNFPECTRMFQQFFLGLNNYSTNVLMHFLCGNLSK
jgi:hypothetical protein